MIFPNNEENVSLGSDKETTSMVKLYAIFKHTNGSENVLSEKNEQWFEVDSMILGYEILTEKTIYMKQFQIHEASKLFSCL
jgi:hypothetical protein